MIKQPLLSIVTRTHNRPQMFYRCLRSVARLTDPRYEHVIIFDDVGGGTKHANELFDLHKDRVRGHYVWILDDDDTLNYPNLVQGIEQIASKDQPDIIICKMFSTARNKDLPDYWGQRKARVGQIGSPCMIVKNAIWKKHIHAFGKGACGDHKFFDAMLKDPEHYTLHWWNQRVAVIPKEHKGRGGN